MAEEPFKSATTQYDNTGGGEASPAKDGGFWSSFGDKFAKTGMSFAGDDLKKLNQLTSKMKGFDSKAFLSDKWSKLKEMGSSFLDTGFDMLKDMGNDALKNMQNMATSFAGNMVEDLYNTIKSAIYIPDIAFAVVLQGLYYGGGSDLAYRNSYIRNQALKRDWDYSLEFLDKAYGIDYDVMTYSAVSRDLRTCVRRSCWKNIHYIFKKLYDQYNKNENAILVDETKSILIGNNSSNEFRQFRIEKQLHLRIRSKIERIMMSITKSMIINSRTYLSARGLEKFFNDFPKILKPRYFGTTDNKWNGEFTISKDEIMFMMPDFKEHDVSKTDESVYDTMMAENDELALSASQIKDNQTGSLTRYRQKMLDRQTMNQRTVARAAIKGGVRGVVEDVRNRYPAANARKKRKVVKYGNWTLGDMLDKALDGMTATKFISPRNENIKQLYILMSSKSLFGDDRMVNKPFYERCKIKTMTSMIAAADKAIAIAGASMIFQNLANLYELDELLSSLAYRLTVKMDKWLFDPLKNKSYEQALTEATFNSEFSYTKGYGYNVRDSDLVYEELSDSEVVKPMTNNSENPNVVPGPNPSTGGTNPNAHATSVSANTSFLKKINDALDKNLDANEIVSDVMRYCNKIPMIPKRDILVEFLVWFYDNMEVKKVLTEIKNLKFAHLIYNVFGKSGYTSTNDILSLFNKSTNESLDANIKIIVAVNVLGMIDEALSIKSSDDKYKDTICNLYKMMTEMFARKVENYGLGKAIFLYDKDYLKSLVKQTFNDQIEHLKSINSKDNKFFDTFYPLKDTMTAVFEGFDRGGIMGYDTKKDHIQYTEMETGDWMSSAVTSNGTFFGGSENTDNNGIVRINEDTKTLVRTNIIKGNWTEIVEYLGITFFVKDNSEVYYWNNDSVVATSITNYSDWDVVPVYNANKLLLLSKKNEGIRIWNFTDFISVTSEGGGYKILPTGFGSYIIYATKNPSNIQLLTSASIDNISGNNIVIANSCSIHTIDSTISRQVQVPAPSEPSTDESSDSSGGESGGTTTETVIDNYKDRHYIFGTSKGLLDCRYYCSVTDASSLYMQNPNKSEYVVNHTENESHVEFIDEEHFYLIELGKSINDIKTCELNNNMTSSGGPIDDTLLKNETSIKTIEHGTITKVSSDEKYMYVYSTVPNTGNNRISLFNSELNNNQLVINGVSNEDIPTLEFDFIPGKSFRFARKDKDILNFNESNYTLTSIFTKDSDKVNDWEFIELSTKLYLNNPKEKLGLRYLQNNEAKETSLLKGSWNLTESPSMYLATSTDNTNMGIRTSKDGGIVFSELEGTKINEHDFSKPGYDYTTEKFYFGMDRHETIMNLNTITYDIDEFIYPLQAYQLQEILLTFSDRRFTSLLYSTSKKIKESQNLVLDTSIPGALIPGTNTPNPDAFNSDGTVKPEFGKTNPDSDLNGLSKSVTDLSNEIKDQNNNQWKNSGLYTDIMTYAEAKKEFDMSDVKAIDGLEIEFINEMIGNGLDPTQALQRYRSDHAIYYIHQIDENIKSIDYMCDDYLNADPKTGVIY